MNTKELLEYQLQICKTHVDRLNIAVEKITHLYPFNQETIINLDTESLAYMELFTNRLGKLQDTLGDKVFNFILELLGEIMENKSTLDKLNKLEKLEILPSVTWWQDLRKLRNILVHEYPDNPELIADNLNIAFIQAKRLLTFWDSLQKYINTKILGLTPDF